MAVSSLHMESAQHQAEKYHIPRAIPFDQILADPQIELVLNLTIPAAHGSLGLAVLRAGKSVYNEKPLAISRAEARQMLDEARTRGLRVGCAPDTFLGAGLQTCRKLIDEGAIGQPVAAMGMMLNRGPDDWHPDPAFLFQEGAGSLFDVGPYYLTALITLLGPIRQVSGLARKTCSERKIHSGPKAGTSFEVQADTHIASVLDFASGPIATLVTSFDVWENRAALEIYGSEGSLMLPDPNTFGGPVRLHRQDGEAPQEIPLAFGHAENSRGLGLADMAYAMRSGRAHSASGELAYHVLDVMHAVIESSESGEHVRVASMCDRPEMLVGEMYG